MKKSIVELIGRNQSAEAVTNVQKSLANKLVTAIADQKKDVARDTYGRVTECYGADEAPEFMNEDDNAYASFFQNALKKFGVNGPQDFTDDVAKQRFFDYVDHNWRSQDAVQAVNPGTNQVPPVPGQTPTPGTIQSPAGAGTSLELGTQTQLPPQAATPQPPALPGAGVLPQQQSGVEGGADPSVATMGSAGPSIDKTNPLGADGDDTSLDGMQQGNGYYSFAAGYPPQTDQMGGQDAGNEMGDNSDPDLEIGDDDQVDGDQQDFSQNPDDEQGFGGNEDGDNFGDENNQDDGDSGFGDDDQDSGNFGQSDDQDDQQGDDEDLDDHFDDEDAFTVDPSDFVSNNGDDEDDSDNFDDEDEDEDSDDDDDDDDLDDDRDGRNDDDEDEDDPDLEVGSDDDDRDSDESDDDDDDFDDRDDDRDNDDEDQDDQDDEQDAAPVKKSFNKKFAEDFGFGIDNADDDVFIAESMMQQGADQKKVAYVQDQLTRIKKMRNAMLIQLRRERAAIKKDGSLSDEQKYASLKHLAGMAGDNRKFFKNQAKQVKAMFTGSLGEQVDISEAGSPLAIKARIQMTKNAIKLTGDPSGMHRHALGQLEYQLRRAVRG